MDPEPPLHAEIRDRLGVLPNFFRLAPEMPQIADGLWGFAKTGYLDNPLPPLFKERLFVSLSRFCKARYCVLRHVGFLTGLGHPAGNPDVQPETVAQTVALLQRALPRDAELEPQIERVGAHRPPVLPAPSTPLEEAIFDCVAHVFLQTPQASRCLEALASAFAPADLQHLLVFLAFVRTAHFWTLVHPELEAESDVSALLTVQQALAQSIAATAHAAAGETPVPLSAEPETLRHERDLRHQLERANTALRAERERLQITLESIGDAVMTTDRHGRVTGMNPTAERLTGWPAAEAAGRPLDQVFRIVDETTREIAPDPALRALREGTAGGATGHGVPEHNLLIARDGSQRPIDDSAAPIRDAHGHNLGSVLIFRDISGRREAERAAAERHELAELMAAIVDSTDDAIVSKNLDGIIRTWNRAAERLFGYTAAEAIGRHITMIIPPDLLAEEDMIISRIKAGERLEHYDTVRLRKDGRPVQVAVTISPVKDEAGRVIGASKTARDVTRRKQAERELQRYAQQLAEADERKDRFLAILAHELRNPLSPIRSCVQLLKAGAGGEEALDIMDRQVNQMVRLIDDLLDVSRISRGKLELRKGESSLRDVLRGAVEAVQPMIDEGRHTLTIDQPEAPIVLHADEARLVQVFANLLTNAAKYSEPGSTITVQAMRDGDRVRVRVIDEGIGIAADEIDRVFEMFRQLENAPHTAQGLGIGLTMAKDLVELHGGRLEARSDGPGQGATFEVTLPVDAAAAPASPAPDPARAPGKAGMRVLVVDDSRDSATALSRLLTLRGCVARTAFDGEEALRVACNFLPDVIFLDIGMPGMSGLDTAREVRSAPWGRDVRLVALSGWGQAIDRQRSRDAGFDEHLIKPAAREDLDRVLANAG